MVAHTTRGDLGQGGSCSLIPRLEDAPEDPLWGGGLSHQPGGCGSPGEHGVRPPEDPWAFWCWAGDCRGGHYVIVPAFEDCAPDLWRGPVAVCRWGGEVVVGGVESGCAEGRVAVWCCGLFPLFPVVWVCRVVLLRWGSSKACRSLAGDVSFGLVFQGLAPLHGGDPDALVLHALACPPEEEVHNGLLEISPWGGEVPEGLGGELGPAPL